MTTTPYLLRDMPLGVAPVDETDLCATPVLVGPVSVLVTYDYEPAIPAVLTLPNGDPGDEPGEAAELSIVRIVSLLPLHFADVGEGMLVSRAAGSDCNLTRYMTDDTLDQIERDLLAELRVEADEGRIDAYLARQQ